MSRYCSLTGHLLAFSQELGISLVILQNQRNCSCSEINNVNLFLQNRVIRTKYNIFIGSTILSSYWAKRNSVAAER